jgi:hypothetical protein
MILIQKRTKKSQADGDGRKRGIPQVNALYWRRKDERKSEAERRRNTRVRRL